MTIRKSSTTVKAKKIPSKPIKSIASKSPTIAKIEDQITKPVNVVRRKEMVERIVASSGLKPNVVKSVLDAVLEELGGALSAGESLNLHPLGKMTVNRQKLTADKEIIICKIRRKVLTSAPVNPLETAAE